MQKPIVEIHDLHKHFRTGAHRVVKSVDGITLSVLPGETVGLVGESGSGKSTLGKAAVGLLEATSGKVLFEGQDIALARGQARRELNRSMQMIFQDPHSSLNPRLRIGDIVAEGIDAHRMATGAARKERIAELLERVGLHPDYAERFPHEFSGGQRQRIGIARALAVKPRFIVADEPISALDVSIQAQIVNLMKDLQTEQGLSYLFIAHDLAMVKHISDRIGVMYLGKLMELADSRSLFAQPLHPYTQALLSAVPASTPAAKRLRERIVLHGEPPSPLSPPAGCPFHARCPSATDICANQMPPGKEVRSNHWVACHLYE
ncbi:ABC transporter ATP-binding protein [Paenibacillus dendritiformis]|uniref:Oligopeptide/dipeptide ABC transporter ATPase n=1 Tax=Paenibacillus dendritiformis C454 TaxID=1131935 RepID=H3S945_9BACL|nr:ABC transporter ATP-binding protein [Paenibacillus dendritiformis]EHQ64293.1 oligopeptide/dipeptide ABC transporter ATPase [Paenibacillus dendritiformis C454]CAH8770494.1 ABC transporter ATP-binding protein [Paenibacillus dendritiformis]